MNSNCGYRISTCKLTKVPHDILITKGTTRHTNKNRLDLDASFKMKSNISILGDVTFIIFFLTVTFYKQCVTNLLFTTKIHTFVCSQKNTWLCVNVCSYV